MDRKTYEFIYSKTGERIIEWKKCKCGEEFPITDKDLEFYDKISPTFGGKKYSIPTPTLCPDCRAQRRFAWRNERKLYKRNSDLTGKPIIGIYSPTSPYQVYDQKEWWSDSWESMIYGKDFDNNKNLFEQIGGLILEIPKINLYVDSSENSTYCNYSDSLKDCYLCIGTGRSENTHYTYVSMDMENSMDCTVCAYSKECYEMSDSLNNYKCSHCQSCYGCTSIYYCYDCTNCTNCYLCTNLINKEYHILNQKYTKDEYKNKILEIKSNWDKYYKKYLELLISAKRRNLYIIGSENCFGDSIYTSKNSIACYDAVSVDNCKFVINCGKAGDTYDVYGISLGSSLVYEGVHILIHKGAFCISCMTNSDIYYCQHCYNCQNIFACIGLRDKQYCILNKQYTKEQYEELVPKIIEHMKSTGERGEFFPASISPFGYNETVANEYYPLDRETALKSGYKRQDKEYPINVPEGMELIQAKDLPENIKDVNNDILNKAIVCEISGKPFRIVKPELEFYRKHNIPLPRKHPDVRHMERTKQRSPRKLFLRTCDKCGVQMISVYPQNSEYTVYCEDCYNKEFY